MLSLVIFVFFIINVIFVSVIFRTSSCILLCSFMLLSLRLGCLLLLAVLGSVLCFLLFLDYRVSRFILTGLGLRVDWRVLLFSVLCSFSLLSFLISCGCRLYYELPSCSFLPYILGLLWYVTCGLLVTSYCFFLETFVIGIFSRCMGSQILSFWQPTAFCCFDYCFIACHLFIFFLLFYCFLLGWLLCRFFITLQNWFGSFPF